MKELSDAWQMKTDASPVNGVTQLQVYRVRGFSGLHAEDMLSVEEPLEIRLCYGPGSQRKEKSISITMRTPGHDDELALGFLFTEGIIASAREVIVADRPEGSCAIQNQNIIRIELNEIAIPQLNNAERNFYTSSSCGVCGKSSIQSIRTVSTFTGRYRPPLNIAAGLFYDLPEKMKMAQSGFSETGGIHAAGLFDVNGDVINIREDVGRHNALDKLIGAELMNHRLPLDRSILLLSGRASFELIQKAAMAGVSVVAAIGAPSSLAVSLATEFDITLIGFLRGDRFNIYTSGHRVTLSPTS